jgi:hypothetical protein
MKAEEDGSRVVREDCAWMRVREREDSEEMLLLRSQARPDRGVNVRAPLDSGEVAPGRRACEVLMFGDWIRKPTSEDQVWGKVDCHRDRMTYSRSRPRRAV